MGVAERTRALFSDRPFASPAGPLAITVSAGVAEAGGAIGFDPQGIFRAADGALYAAKEQGRNRVTRQTGPAPRRPIPPEP